MLVTCAVRWNVSVRLILLESSAVLVICLSVRNDVSTISCRQSMEHRAHDYRSVTSCHLWWIFLCDVLCFTLNDSFTRLIVLWRCYTNETDCLISITPYEKYAYDSGAQTLSAQSLHGAGIPCTEDGCRRLIA